MALPTSPIDKFSHSFVCLYVMFRRWKENCDIGIYQSVSVGIKSKPLSVITAFKHMKYPSPPSPRDNLKSPSAQNTHSHSPSSCPSSNPLSDPTYSTNPTCAARP